MSRRRRIHWTGPLPHKGDASVSSWEDPPADYVPALPPVVVPERSWRDWWPTDPIESDAWAAETLRVVEQVWRIEGASLYWRRGMEEVRDELRGWLVEESLKFRETWTVPEEVTTTMQDAWLGSLHKTMRRKAGWYFSRVASGMHVSEGEARGLVYSTRSVNAIVDASGSDENREAPERRMGALWGHTEPTEGLDFILTVERLERLLAQALEGVPETDPSICAEPGCRDAALWRSWCRRHYTEQRRHWDTPICSVEGCTDGSSYRGLCTHHYHQHRDAAIKAGTWQTVNIKQDPTCAVDGCDTPPISRNLCQRHYNASRDERAAVCSIDGCEGKVRARGWCGKHYQRAKTHGDPLHGSTPEHEARQRGEAA